MSISEVVYSDGSSIRRLRCTISGRDTMGFLICETEHQTILIPPEKVQRIEQSRED